MIFFRFGLLKKATERMDEDGLSSLSYIVINSAYNLLYNNITVKIDVPDKEIDNKKQQQHPLDATKNQPAHKPVKISKKSQRSILACFSPSFLSVFNNRKKKVIQPTFSRCRKEKKIAYFTLLWAVWRGQNFVWGAPLPGPPWLQPSLKVLCADMKSSFISFL